MEQYYLAIDIGASSGRHILGRKEGERMVLEEIHRFPNGMTEKDGELVWDVDGLLAEIKAGMKKCAVQGKIPVSVGIDTWAVDFVLLDEENKRIGNAVAYRDARTRGMDDEVYRIVPEEELYRRTGIQKQIFNTVYQLMALKKRQPQQLAKARKLLMIPDYFHYLLTGTAAAEYTNATTTQLVGPETKTWDMELIKRLGYPEEIFQKIKTPGTMLGNLTEDLQKELGYDCKVILPATHDTGSAVMAVPSGKEDVLYISSGTWSLMGTELMRADCSEESKLHNLTNEGGYDFRFRYLKNIMGLWMIQSVKKEIGQNMDYVTICRLASEETIASLVDCNEERFLSPASMTAEVQHACRDSGQEVPEGIGQTTAVIYNSLAECYARTIGEIEEITGKQYDRIHIVGGGANAGYLTGLTAKATKRTVIAGPIEATAIGNIAAQMIAGGELRDLKEARECIYRSFPMEIYNKNIDNRKDNK